MLVGQFRAPRYVAARQPRRDGRPPPQSPRPRPPPARSHWPRRQGRAPRRPAPARPVLSAAAPPPVRVLPWPRSQLLPVVHGDPRRALRCATGRTAEPPRRAREEPRTPLPVAGRALRGHRVRSVHLFVCLFVSPRATAGWATCCQQNPKRGLRGPGRGGDLGLLVSTVPLRPGRGAAAGLSYD